MFRWYGDGWTNSWPLTKRKNSLVRSSTVLIPEKKRLDTAVRNGSTKNFEKTFFAHLTRNVALKMFYFIKFRLVPENPHEDQKKQCFWDEMSLVSSIYVEFLQSHKPRKDNATFFY